MDLSGKCTFDSGTLLIGLRALFLLVAASVLGCGVVLLLDRYSVKWGVYACAALALLAMILAAGSPKKAILFMLAVSIPLNIDFCIYSRDYNGTINGVFLSGPDLCVGALLVLFAVELCWNRSRQIALFPKATLPLMALIVVSLLSIAVTVDKTKTLYGVVALAKTLLLSLVVANSCDKREARLMFSFLLAGAALAALLYLVQSMFHVNFNLTGQVNELATIDRLQGNARPSGTLGHPNEAGGYFAGMLMIAFASTAMRQNLLSRFCSLCTIGLVSWALMMTFSRTSWIAFACGFLCLLVVGLRRKVLGGSVLAYALVLASIVVVLFGGLIQTRMTTDLATQDARAPLIQQAFYIVKQHPVLGVGANTYQSIMSRYIPEEMGRFWESTVHNGYLYCWVELGLLGLLAFLWFLYSLFQQARMLLAAEDRDLRAIGLGSLSFLVTEALFMYNDHWPVHINSGLVFCVLLALAASLNGRQTASRGDSSASVARIIPTVSTECVGMG